MPVIARLGGVTVRMYHDDHPPPHVHVSYQGFSALVAIRDGSILRGYLPPQISSRLKVWCVKSRFQLRKNWQRATRFEPLLPLEDNEP